MAIGASLTQTYWENAAKETRADLVGIIDPAIRVAPPPSLPVSSAPYLVSRTVDGQAVMLATDSFYAWATILILIFAALIWMAKRPQGPLAPGGHG